MEEHNEATQQKRMKDFKKALALALLSCGIMANNAPAAIPIDTVPVFNAGNPSDTTGYGAVGYYYRLGTYEVTLSQYTAFLNAVAAADTYGLYSTSMGSYAQTMGIARSGSSGSYSYSVIGSGNRPVTFVSWFDAARFANWLENGQPTGAQGASTTERGSYTLDGAVSGVGFTRNAGAKFALPTENEWYKAAYYQPAAQGGDTDGYWLYPTGGNTQPNSRNGSATDPNSANFYYNDNIANGYNGGYAVNDSPTLPAGTALTDAGAFSLADSFYGTFDQGGNVWEWNEAIIGTSRGLRGGAWNDGENPLRSSYRNYFAPTAQYSYVGFRIMMIPEPTAAGLLAVGIALVAWTRKRVG